MRACKGDVLQQSQLRMGHLASTRSLRPILLYTYMLNHASSHHSCHMCEDVPEAEVLQENGGIARRPSFDASSMGVVQPDCSKATKGQESYHRGRRSHQTDLGRQPIPHSGRDCIQHSGQAQPDLERQYHQVLHSIKMRVHPKEGLQVRRHLQGRPATSDLRPRYQHTLRPLREWYRLTSQSSIST